MSPVVQCKDLFLALFLIYINDILQAAKCNLCLYGDDSCLVSQHKEINKIEKQPNEDFENVSGLFVDNKLSYPFCRPNLNH